MLADNGEGGGVKLENLWNKKEANNQVTQESRKKTTTTKKELFLFEENF